MARRTIEALRLGAAFAMTMTAVLTLSGPASARLDAAAERAGELCADGETGGRVAPGAEVEDPDSLTPEQIADMERRFDERLAAMTTDEQREVRLDAAPVTISVYWHVITRNNGTGGVTDEQIEQQLEVLNEAFAGSTSSDSSATRFSFETAEITTTANSKWYTWDSEVDDGPAKEALRQGDASDLNVYLPALGDGLLGYATYPGGDLTSDGVVSLNASLPGGSSEGANLGDTTTHEVGHWLGLAHTFDGGCSRRGDMVADTAAQADGDNVFECDESLDTCPAPGTDPVHNFMSYGDDTCLDLFTAGQATRMSEQWEAFRAG